MIDALDRTSLEQFQLELVQAGFTPEDLEQRFWTGPIAESLTALTAAPNMTIVFSDGWPFQHPRLVVPGLDEQHVMADGQVCLWAIGAPPEEWLTFDRYRLRIDEWAKRAKSGFQREDFALDAYRYFETVRRGTFATAALEELGIDAVGEVGRIAGSWKKKGRVLELKRGSHPGIDGRSYHVATQKTPPRDLDGVRAALNDGQRRNFDRRYYSVATSGSPRLFVLTWQRELGREVLVLLAERANDGKVAAESLEVAPTDLTYLRLRAGADARVLAQKRVVMFGAGAVGSSAGLLLAECGVETLMVVDAELLRPANVVRHAADSVSVGNPKAFAMGLLARLSAPWTDVRPVLESPWQPSRIRELIRNADLVLDATGSASFALLTAHLCEEARAPLVSAALYRAGAVGRVRRQAMPADTPLRERAKDGRYPRIPPGQEPIAYEPGCSSPVDNASPIAVAAIAALAAEIAVDCLAGRYAYTDECIDIYRALDAPPFDQLGRLRS